MELGSRAGLSQLPAHSPAPKPTPTPWEPGDLFVFLVKRGALPFVRFLVRKEQSLLVLLPGFPAIDTDSDNESKGQERLRQGG